MTCRLVWRWPTLFDEDIVVEPVWSRSNLVMAIGLVIVQPVDCPSL